MRCLKKPSRARVTTAGAWFNEEAIFSPWVRLNVGGRVDGTTFSVDDRLGMSDPGAPRSGVASAVLLSPKANLILSPLRREDVRWDLLRELWPWLSQQRRSRGVLDASGDTAHPSSRGRGWHPGAALRPPRPGGDWLGAWARQRDSLGW